MEKCRKCIETKNVICVVCDNYCPLKAKIIDGRLQNLEPQMCIRDRRWSQLAVPAANCRTQRR